MRIIYYYIVGLFLYLLTFSSKPINTSSFVLQSTTQKHAFSYVCHPQSVSTYKYTTKTFITSHVTLTCYRPIKEECDDSPLVTSDGSTINLGHLKSGNIKWCAVSRDLLYLFPKDKPRKIWIEGYGIYEVKDVMSRRHKHSVDLLIHPKDSMRIKLANVKVRIIND